MPQGRVFRIEEVPWRGMSGHEHAFSKLLINPENSETKYLDFRISTYTPMGFVAPHVHQEAENVYYVIQGKGLFEMDGQKTVVEPHMVMFVPPGVEHAISNTGIEDLTFLVIAVPASDMQR
jgi:mannose-6-phosphate isomerase-like protein (cupin superfamily)